jgi:hypothetical protein
MLQVVATARAGWRNVVLFLVVVVAASGCGDAGPGSTETNPMPPPKLAVNSASATVPGKSVKTGKSKRGLASSSRRQLEKQRAQEDASQ